jgi:sulfopyruvate decarboxylase alpha subunit
MEPLIQLVHAPWELVSFTPSDYAIKERKMNAERYLLDILHQERIAAIATLPCGKIQNLLDLVIKHFKNVPLTREEEGIGICTGAYLAGTRMALLIQSSGVGNSINALMSLAKLFEIPIPIFISWRGVWHEEVFAQTMMGKTLPDLLNALDFAYLEVWEPKDLEKIKEGLETCYQMRRPYFFLLSPKIWKD